MWGSFPCVGKVTLVAVGWLFFVGKQRKHKDRVPGSLRNSCRASHRYASYFVCHFGILAQDIVSRQPGCTSCPPGRLRVSSRTWRRFGERLNDQSVLALPGGGRRIRASDFARWSVLGAAEIGHRFADIVLPGGLRSAVILRQFSHFEARIDLQQTCQAARTVFQVIPRAPCDVIRVS